MSATSGRILIEILSKSREQKARGTKKVERNDLKNTKGPAVRRMRASYERQDPSVLKTRKRRRVGFQG